MPILLGFSILASVLWLQPLTEASAERPFEIPFRTRPKTKRNRISFCR